MTRNCSVLLVALPLAGCYGLYGHDEIDRYYQRSDTITMSAGNAPKVNAVAQSITPWPPYVGDRRLAYDSRRVGAAVTRYGAQQRPKDQLPDIEQEGKLMGPKDARETVNTSINSVSVQGLGGATGGVAVGVSGN